MSWIPDFVETFEAKMHSEMLTKFAGIALAPVPSKYEGHRAMLLYMSVLGLKVLGQEETLARLRPQVAAYIQASVADPKSECSIGESPFLKTRMEAAGSHGLVTTYLQLATLSLVDAADKELTGLIAGTLGRVHLKKLDLRSLYCYCALKTHFGLGFVDTEAAEIAEIISDLKTYEGAYALAPAGEAHAAATYLSVACLKMVGVSLSSWEAARVVGWVVGRQEEMGFSVA